MTDADLLLATTPHAMPGASRATGLWVSPLIVNGWRIVDTAALQPGDRAFAGPDRYPDACVLVVVSPREHRRLRDDAARALLASPLFGVGVPATGAQIAANIVDARCREDPALADRLRWRWQR